MNVKTKKAYYITFLQFNRNDLRDYCWKFRSAPTSELGIDITASYVPWTSCSLYVPLTKPARHKLSEEYGRANWSFRILLCLFATYLFENRHVSYYKSWWAPENTDMDMIANALWKCTKTPNLIWLLLQLSLIYFRLWKESARRTMPAGKIDIVPKKTIVKLVWNGFLNFSRVPFRKEDWRQTHPDYYQNPDETP